MTNLLSRRTFLQRAPIAAAAIATPVTIAVVEVRAEPIEHSDMKCMRLARELFNAMKAHYGPGCSMVRNETNGSILFVPPPPPSRIVEFAGPGWYEVESRGPELPTREMFIEISHRHAATSKDGRWFRAAAKDMGSEGPVYYQESWLRQIIVRKLEGHA